MGSIEGSQLQTNDVSINPKIVKGPTENDPSQITKKEAKQKPRASKFSLFQGKPKFRILTLVPSTLFFFFSFDYVIISLWKE